MDVQRINSLPIAEDDVIFTLKDKKIKVATALIGEINHLPSSASTEDGEIFVMWHTDYSKQRIPAKEVRVLENRCEVGMGVSSLVEQAKYGICVKKRTYATCVVLDDKEVKYLLSVDTDRLRSFSDINHDLCFYKNAISEVSDINYSINLSFNNLVNVEICTTRRNFMKRFVVLDDTFNRNFPKDKAHELNFVNRCPMSFDEIIGKIVSIKSSELLKFKNNLELKELITMIDKSDDQGKIDKGDKNEVDTKKQNETITICDLMSDENNKENKSVKINDFKKNRNLNKANLLNRDKQVNFTVSDVKIYEVIMNTIKDFAGSNNDQDFKTEKVKAGEQLDKVKFFKINDKHVELGSRWKLDLTEQDNLVSFEEYQDHIDANVKAKIEKLPKQTNKMNLSDCRVEVSQSYEKDFVQSIDRSIKPCEPNNEESKSASLRSLSKLENSFVIIDPLDEDDVFLEESQPVDKQLTKEEIKNQNLKMLARLNRRSRNTSSRTNSLNTRTANDRLMNSSFKKVKLGSTSQEIERSDKAAIKQTVQDDPTVICKTVLVDVLYVDTFVDIKWQDNTFEANIPLSHVSEEIDNLIQKYYPGNFVEFTDEAKECVPTYGVIQNVNQNSNIAQVKWFYEAPNDNEASKSWITSESLFNLRPSCIHFHLNDVVVGSDLITNFTKASIEDIPRLIGTINQISTEGQGLISWIDGTESWKKLVELVSFFDVEFSDFSDDEDSLSSLDSKENSDMSHEWVNANEDSITTRFIDDHKFNKQKFECINDDLNALIDENRLKERWLKKIEKMFDFIDEFKGIQLDRLNKQAFYKPKNLAEDKKIVGLTFEIIKCYYDKIRQNITAFNMQPKDKNHFDDFYLQLVFSLNNWLDVIQSNYYYLYLLFEESAEFEAFKRLSMNLSRLASKDSTLDEHELCKTLSDSFKADENEAMSKKQVASEYKRKMAILIDNFNNEVAKRVNLDDEEMDQGDSNSVVSANFTPSAILGNNTEQASSTAFNKLDCLSLEENNIKHEYMKQSSLNSALKKTFKVNAPTLQREFNLLRQNLPESGIYFRTFEERLDLVSLMIEGPTDTVYENHLFLFDIKINENMTEPPDCAYLSFGKKQINPNLYTDGNVCLSLLNTFFSKSRAERWQAHKSSLLQLALSLQALVLNANPFYNEADFDCYVNTVEGRKKSKLYNEFVIINLIDYSIDLMRKRNDFAFKNEINSFYQANAYNIYKRYFDFVHVSMKWNLKQNEKLTDQEVEKQFNEMVDREFPTFKNPTFILLPASEGFCLTLAKNLKSFVSFFKEQLPAAQIEVHEKQIEDLISSIKV